MRFLQVLLACIALGLLPSCHGTGPGGHGRKGGDADDRKVDPRPLVEVAPVGRGDVAGHLVATGTVESEAQADLVPEATGTVVEIRAEEGDRVHRGQVLAVIENPNLAATLERARAEAERSQRELERARRLHEQGAVSDRELQDARFAAATARTALEEARGTQGHTRLLSPIDGTVSIRDIRLGEVAGARRAFQVVDLDRLRVVVQVPEKDLSRLAAGQPATLASVYDPGGSVPARVARIAPTVDPTTGTVRVTLSIEPGQGVLRPGQFVSARIEVARHEGVLVVPRRALRYDEGDPVVYVVREEPEEPRPEASPDEGSGEDGDGDQPPLPGPRRIAHQVRVETGFADGDVVELLSGVSEGDPVVLEGNAALRDGARVRLPGDPTLADAEEPEEADGG